MRQRWNKILQAEGLGEIDFVSRAAVRESAAAYHQARTTTDKLHFSDPQAIARISEVLAEYVVPEKHRAVLHRYVRGLPLRRIAELTGVSKDTAHRIVLRYLGNDSYATTAEVSGITPRAPLDARRARVSQGTKAHRRPLSGSEVAEEYLRLGRLFSTVARFQWERDREIWDLHLRGLARRKIERELGVPHTTVQRAILRVRRSFKQWLATRPKDEPDDATQIRATFEEFANFERES